MLLHNDDNDDNDNKDAIKDGRETTENCDQLLLDVRFDPDSGKYTLPYTGNATVYTQIATGEVAGKLGG